MHNYPLFMCWMVWKWSAFPTFREEMTLSYVGLKNIIKSVSVHRQRPERESTLMLYYRASWKASVSPKYRPICTDVFGRVNSTLSSIKILKQRGTIFPVHVIKAYGGRRVIPPFTLNICTSCTYRSHTVYFTPRGKASDSYWVGAWVCPRPLWTF